MTDRPNEGVMNRHFRKPALLAVLLATIPRLAAANPVAMDAGAEVAAITVPFLIEIAVVSVLMQRYRVRPVLFLFFWVTAKVAAYTGAAIITGVVERELFGWDLSGSIASLFQSAGQPRWQKAVDLLLNGGLVVLLQGTLLTWAMHPFLGLRLQPEGEFRYTEGMLIAAAVNLTYYLSFRYLGPWLAPPPDSHQFLKTESLLETP